MVQAVSNLEAKVATDIDTVQQNLDTDIQDMDERVTLNYQKIAELEPDQAALNQEFAQITESVSAINPQLTDIRDDLDTLALSEADIQDIVE